MSEVTKRNDNKLFNSLYKITVNDVVEKRNKLTNLSVLGMGVGRSQQNLRRSRLRNLS